MANGKVIVIAPEILPAMWDMFMARKPAGFEVTLVKHNEGEKKLASEVAGADYLVSLMGGRFPAAVLDAGRQLKLILTMGIGTDHLPVKYALEKKIPVTNNGGGNAITAAEHTLLLMLACLRRFTLFNLDVRAGTWRNWPVVGSLELYDTTVGIIGLGNIGRRVAKLCTAKDAPKLAASHDGTYGGRLCNQFPNKAPVCWPVALVVRNGIAEGSWISPAKKTARARGTVAADGSVQLNLAGWTLSGTPAEASLLGRIVDGAITASGQWRNGVGVAGDWKRTP